MILLNTFLFTLMFAVFGVGLVQFKLAKMQDNNIEEVPHEEAHPEKDPVKVVHVNTYALHGLGKFRRELNRELKKTYRNLNDKVQEWASKQNTK